MNKNTHRRDFLKNTLKGTLAITIGKNAIIPFIDKYPPPNPSNEMPMDTGFDQQPLPYSCDALEDVIDAKTMEIHYSKHAAAYSKNLKEAVAAEASAAKSVEEILKEVSKYTPKMRNNAGGHYNHEMFWQCMRPKLTANRPTGKLLSAIESSFTSFDTFKTQLSAEGKNRFGSGWAWLYLDKNKKLKVGSSPNQDNPLMNISDLNGFPLLGLDVWEHAYYLKYQNRRADYIENWWAVINWDYVQKRFQQAM